MDVLQKCLIAANFPGAAGRQGGGGVKKKKVGVGRLAGGLANQLVKAGIGAKRKGVAIAGLLKMFPRGGEICHAPQAPG